MNKPIAVVLGGTNPHKALIENLQGRGYYTILVDYLDSPPAADVADEHLKESTLDREKVLQIAKENNADLVIATCVDQANVIACYVAEKLNLPHPYSYENASLIADKTSMKQKMIDVGIPTAKYVIAESIDEIDLNTLSFPIVVKPSDSNGSKGVRKVDNTEELTIYLNEALKISRNGKAIVEEFIEGDEVGIDCFITEGKAHVITTHKKRKPQLKDGSVIFSIGSISPVPISKIAQKKIESVAHKIANTFNLRNTPLLMQVMVKNDEIKVIEFAPRIGGGLNFRKILLFAGFDILNASIDSYLNNKIDVKYKFIDHYYSENHIYTKPGRFGRIEGIEKLIKNDTMLEYYPNKIKGQFVSRGNASKDRIGSFIVKGDSIETIQDKLKTIIDSISVLDSNGSCMEYPFNKSMYYNII